MVEFINIKTCRRAYLGGFIDGEGYNCILYPNCQLCDNCIDEEEIENNQLQLISSIIRKTSIIKINNENKFINIIREMVNILESSWNCIICQYENDNNYRYKHYPIQCNKFKCLRYTDKDHYTKSCKYKFKLLTNYCYICTFPIKTVNEMSLHLDKKFGKDCSSLGKDKILLL